MGKESKREPSRGRKQGIINSLIKEEEEELVSREAALRTMKKMDPNEVWDSTIDRKTLKPKKVYIKDKVKQAERGLKLDKLRLESLHEMYDNL